MAGFGDRAAVTWARADLRRRWRSLVVLGLLAGLTAGFAMASLAGARRAERALPRFRAATDAPDAIVFPGQVGATRSDWDGLRALPEVADVAVWNLLFGTQDGQPGSLFFAAQDDGYLHRISAPIVLDGRMWDPAADDEVVVTEALARVMPLGSSTVFQTFGVDQSEADAGPVGPTFTFRVVGVVRTVNEFLFTDGQVFVGPGFRARHGDDVQLIENADVRLRHGTADIPALQRDAAAVMAPGTPVLDLHAVSRRVDTTVSVEHAALLMLAAAVAVAGGMLVAQALRRSAGTIQDDALVLRSMGMTPVSIAAAGTLAHLLSAGIAVVAGVGTAVAASRAFPVGLSRKLDPDVAFHLDWPVVVGGALLAGLALAGDTYLVARRSASRPANADGRPSALVGLLRSRLPVPLGIGASMAFERGTGPNRVAVRPALVGAVVGVLGVVGALSVDHAVDQALAHPERAGVTWDATVDPQTTQYVAGGLDPALLDAVEAAVPEGTALATAARLVVPVDGVGIQSFTVEPHRDGRVAPIQLTITAGRPPAREGEAAIGPKTARDLHVGLGDEVGFGPDDVALRIVGIGLFPPDVHTEFDEGLWVTPPDLAKVLPPFDPEALFAGAERAVLVRYPSGTDAAAAIEALGAALGDEKAIGVGPAEVPVELTNLRNVRVLPIVLAAFLALLAMAAVSHVLVTSARHRRRDFAVLRAVGVNRRGTRLAFNAQGTTIGLVGLVVGVPLGVAVGRTCWHWVAGRVPLEDVPPFALVAVIVTLPVAVLVVNALAVWPGRRIGRLHPAEVLRAE